MDSKQIHETPILKRTADFLAGLSESRATRILVPLLITGLFIIGNVPWHLDNYDQAKQAYVPFEIVKTGSWWYQHTPAGRFASKPPLMGWISIPIYWASGWWEIALRLPAFLCAAAMLLVLMSEGRRILPAAGGAVAAAAFGLNLLSPRLATLVRTDMMLAFFIFLIGWIIYRTVSDGKPWTATDRWLVFLFMLAALYTKGPVIYAFLLPGIAAFALFAPQPNRRRLVWSGWWTWLIPLALFLAWAVYAYFHFSEFKEDVVNRELMTRFQERARDDERPQPIFFYFPHLFHKWAPWSLLLIAIACISPAARRRLREDAGTFWLLAWSAGGLLLMTFIPAKRVDRIFPVVPPFCLLLVSMLSASWHDRRVKIACGASIIASALFAGGYFAGLVPLSFSEGSQKLVEFSKKAREAARASGVEKVGLLRARDEALLIYFDQLLFLSKEDGFDEWQKPGPVALVMSDRTAERFREQYPAASPALDSGPLERKNEKRYFLFIK